MRELTVVNTSLVSGIASHRPVDPRLQIFGKNYGVLGWAKKRAVCTSPEGNFQDKWKSDRPTSSRKAGYTACKESSVPDSLGLVDFAIGLVNSVLNLPVGQVKYFEEFKLQKNCEINSAHQKVFGASWNDVWASINYSTCSFSLPKWQALKMTFFAPWSNKFTNLNGKYSALFYCSYF